MIDRPYDVPAALEGPDNGLTEYVAELIWDARAQDGRPFLQGKYKRQISGTKARWRKTAQTVIDRLLSIGFVGPGGHPYVMGVSYAWCYDANEWEIHDGAKGFVALVREEYDVPLILAAPKMALAIRNLLERLGDDPAAKMPEIVALAEATKGLERLTFDVEETTDAEPS